MHNNLLVYEKSKIVSFAYSMIKILIYYHYHLDFQ